MDRRPVQPRPLAATALLLAASVGLHALVVSGVAGRWGGPGDAPPPRAPVEVTLLAPPAPPAPASGESAGTRAATRAAPAVSARAGPAAPSVRTRPSPPLRTEEDAPGASPPAASPEHAPDAGAMGLGFGTDYSAEAPSDVDEPPGAPGTGVATAAAAAAVPGGEGASAAVGAAAPRPGPAAAPPGPALPPLPASQQHRFRVYWGDYTEARSVARLEYRLVSDGEHYEVRTSAEAEGLISLVYAGTLTQVSTGRLGPGGLEPLRYAEQRGRRPERAVGFDPVARRLVPTGGRGPSVPMPPGTQDRLSVLYQIGLLARAEPHRFVAGATRELPVATLREVRLERFEVVGDEWLLASGGPIRALHLHRPPPPGTDDPRIDVWLGYDLEMLPVRLRVEDADRRVLDQVIERGG
jgi:hypothetical protein